MCTLNDFVSDPRLQATIVIPAHNEEQTISRLLKALEPLTLSDDWEIIVVCNGCTDATVDIARSFAVKVIDVPTPGKANALLVGDRAALSGKRVLIDADVEISALSVAALVAAIDIGGASAAGPARVIPRTGVNRLVVWYYDIWEILPSVRDGLYGRGVIALSETGVQRIRELPPTMSDDLAVSDAFGPSERIVVPTATVVVRPPKTVRDLLRRRSRIATGNYQADRQAIRRAESRTGLTDITQVLRDRPSLLGKIAVFLAIAAIARLRASRAVVLGDFSTWERDESSRGA